MADEVAPRKWTTLSPTDLADLAWKLINEGVQTKRITVPVGFTVPVEDEQYVKLLQWIATLKMKSRRSTVTKPEDFKPRVTKG